MTIRNVVLLPDPVLRKTCERVEQVDDGIRALVEDMFETMYDQQGIGLAANQVSVLKRVIVLDVPVEEDAPPDPRVLINPEILWRSEETEVFEEGCLSLPDYRQDVKRSKKVGIRYLSENGETKDLEAEDLLARCIQHELDHLDGKLILDYLTKLKREIRTKKLMKQYSSAD